MRTVGRTRAAEVLPRRAVAGAVERSYQMKDLWYAFLVPFDARCVDANILRGVR